MIYRIDDIAIINADNIKKSDKFTEIEYLDTSSIQEGNISGTQFLNKDSAPSRAKRKVKNNTIIYSTVRPNLKHYGILRNPPQNFIVSTGFATIDLKDNFKDKISPDYLYLLLSQDYVTNYLHGIAENSVSSYPSINPSDIAILSFSFPEFAEQKRIAKVLNEIDKKINNNKHINIELEAMAKELYDYWFVQFDFPREDGKPYKSSGGKMVYNPILKREIPDGWEVKKLEDILNDAGEPLNVNNRGNLPYTPIDYFPKKTMSFGEYLPTEEAKSSLLKYEKDNILIGSMRVYFHRVCIAPYNGITRTTTIVLKPKRETDFGFIYEELRKLYNKSFKPLSKYVVNNELEIMELRKLRNELLPMLMNGQVEVK